MASRMFVLVGAHAGKTINLGSQNQYPFVDGKMTVLDELETIDKVAVYIGRSYWAFEEGSKEMRVAEAILAAKDNPELQEEISNAATPDEALVIARGGKNGVSKSEAAPVERDSKPISSGTPPTTEGSFNKGTDDSGGDGNIDSGKDKLRTDGSGLRPEATLKALRDLNPENDEHWTVVDGLPRVDVINTMLGTDLSRVDISDVLPGFNREVAREG